MGHQWTMSSLVYISSKRGKNIELSTYVWDWDNGSGAQGDNLAVSALSWVRSGSWGRGDFARVGTSACWVTWGSDSDSCGGLGL